MKCRICGKFHLFGRYCSRCTQKIPSGYTHVKDSERTAGEIKRNEAVKSKFKATMVYGDLEIDTESRAFHIGNAYYRMLDIEGFSFYSGEPRFGSTGATSQSVYADVYMTFTPREEERRVRRLRTDICRYEKTDRTVFVEPPLQIHNLKATFFDMFTEERDFVSKMLQSVTMSDLTNTFMEKSENKQKEYVEIFVGESEDASIIDIR